jgi:hypothetical protein
MAIRVFEKRSEVQSFAVRGIGKAVLGILPNLAAIGFAMESGRELWMRRFVLASFLLPAL